MMGEGNLNRLKLFVSVGQSAHQGECLFPLGVWEGLAHYSLSNHLTLLGGAESFSLIMDDEL